MLCFDLKYLLLPIIVLASYTPALTQRIVVPDDFKVTDEMFGTDTSENARRIKFGSVVSDGMVWFGNRSLNQTLIIELYTDNFRNVLYLLKNDDIPANLMSKIEFTNEDGDMSGIKEIKAQMGKFIKAAKQIDKHFFISRKGFRIGEDTTRAFNFYGPPQKKIVKGSLTQYQWVFMGENSDHHANKKSAIAKDSFGYQVTIFFRNGLLIGLILDNDIP